MSLPLLVFFFLSGASNAPDKEFIYSLTLTTLRNNLTGGVGHKFTVGSRPITVYALARWVASGNTGSHTVKLVQSTGGTAGTDVTGGSVVINTSGAPAGAYKWGNLAAPVVLSANTTYYIFQTETSGGDQWFEYTTAIQTMEGATKNTAAYYLDSSPTVFTSAGTAGDAYGAPNFRYKTDQVVLESPAYDAALTDTTPTFEFFGNDPANQDLRYNLQISPNTNFGLLDSYSEVNQSNEQLLNGQWTDLVAAGQSFIGDGGKISSVKFYLRKNTTEIAGPMYAKVYASTGTHGTDAKPTGTALATSAAIEAGTLSTGFALTEFIFSGVNQITLTAGTTYIIILDCLEAGDVGASNGVMMAYDSTSPSHPGNRVFWDAFWVADSASDSCFYLYTVIIDKDSGGDVNTIDTFTSTSTWTCPAGVTSVIVEARGGGGAGGAGASGNTTGGTGGGGGAYSKGTVSVTPGNVYTVTVGAGGTGVVDANGNPGGDSWFSSAATVMAKGGNGGIASSTGAGGTGGTVAASVGTTKFAGGNGGSGNTSASGGGGGGAGDAANGGNGGNAGISSGGIAGTAGSAGGGAGGAGVSSAAAGNAGSIPGGAGAGGYSAAGGAGARGEVKITSTPRDLDFVNTVNGADTSPFTSGQKIAYTPTTALASGTYWLRVKAIAPSGSNTWTSWSETRRFTISSSGSDTLLTIQNSSHAHTIDSPTLTTTIHETLTVANATHTHTADSPTLTATVHETLTVQNASHAHTATSPTPTTTVHETLTVANVAHAHTADSPTPTQTLNETLAVQDATHSHTADSPTITQTINETLVVQNTDHAHSADSPTLTSASTLSVESATHSHTAESPALTSESALSIDNTAHTHTADTPTITQNEGSNDQLLTVQDATHAHETDSPTLTSATDTLLTIADVSHAHTADNPELTLASLLTVDNSAHNHTSDQPELVTASALTIDDTVHAHTADTPTPYDPNNIPPSKIMINLTTGEAVYKLNDKYIISI